jgi:hypothetical protein
VAVKKEHKFPAVLYVSTFTNGDGDIDVASSDGENFADGDTVGVYHFVKSGKVKKTLEVK